MWIFLLFLFVFAEGTAKEMDCSRSGFEQCDRPKLFDEIPREVEEFNAMCPYTLTYIKCIGEYTAKCEGVKNRRSPTPEVLANIYAVFDEMCKEGTALNEVAISNLKCFNETFSNTNCPSDINDFINSMAEASHAESATSNYDYPAYVFCLNELLLLSCIVEDININCGIRARSATMEFLQRTSFADEACPLTNGEALLEDIGKFDLTETQKIFIIAELERMKLSDKA